MKAIEQGVAREKMSREELTKQAERMIRQSRETTIENPESVDELKKLVGYEGAG